MYLIHAHNAGVLDRIQSNRVDRMHLYDRFDPMWMVAEFLILYIAHAHTDLFVGRPSELSLA